MNPRPETSDGLTASEAILGNALVLIHRALPLLRQPDRAADAQKALLDAASLIETARLAHAGERGSQTAPVPVPPEPVEDEIVAIVAAAVAVTLNRPHRVVSVVPADISTPHLNVWAFEGRSQLFVSHRVR